MNGWRHRTDLNTAGAMRSEGSRRYSGSTVDLKVVQKESCIHAQNIETSESGLALMAKVSLQDIEYNVRSLRDRADCLQLRRGLYSIELSKGTV